MKKTISAIITLIVLISINYLLSNLFKIDFLELFAIVGLVATIITGFFTTEGGRVAYLLESKYKHFTFDDDINASCFIKHRRSTMFKVSLVYAIVGIIVTIVFYSKYF